MSSARHRARRELRESGLDLPEQPAGEMPELPDDITALADRQLMALFAELSAWTDYAAGVVAECQIDEEHAAARLDQERAEAALRHTSEKSVTAQKNAALADPGVRDLDEQLQLTRARRRLTEVVRDAADRRAAVVSRELTRRVGRHDRDARSARWNP